MDLQVRSTLEIIWCHIKKQGILFQIEDLQNAANGELKGVAYINSTEKKVNVRLYVSQLIFLYFKLTLLCSR